MNTEAIKSFTLQIKNYGGNEIGESVSKAYIFTCRKRQKEFRIPIKKSDEIEYTLSLHLMSCEYYSHKLEEAST